MVAAVTLPPKRVLQAAVTQLGQDALGIPPTTPAPLQSAARVGEIIPDQLAQNAVWTSNVIINNVCKRGVRNDGVCKNAVRANDVIANDLFANAVKFFMDSSLFPKSHWP